MTDERLPTRHAFSLVELSIVLVILGLLVGGVLSGQSLIRAAELRSVASEYSKYIQALNSFKDKYFAIPGDMANATSFWGKDTTLCNGSPGAAGTPGTCNGNGNGTLEWWGLGMYEGPLHSPGAWQHLALAGLIEGTYTLIGAAPVGGQSNPKSKVMGSAVWDVGSVDMGIGGWAGSNDNRLTLMLFSSVRNPGTGAWTGVMKAEEAWNIDTKMDDGKPGMGKVRSWLTPTLCWTTVDNSTPETSSATSTYNLTGTEANACALIFATP